MKLADLLVSKKGNPIVISVFIVIILLLGNNNAMIDYFIHPEIPYFDKEHLIVGAIAGLFAFFFSALIFFYIKWLQKINSERGEFLKELTKAKEKTDERQEEYKNIAHELNKAQSVTKVGSWKWSFQDNHLEWSDEMYRIFGIQKDKFTGNLADVIQQSIHPDDRAAVEASYNSIIEKSIPVTLEYRIVMPDGTIKTVWVEAGELIIDAASKPIALTGIVQDITERKLAEEALLANEQRLASIFDTVGDNIFLLTFEGDGTYRFNSVNKAFCKTTGLNVEEIVGRLVSEVIPEPSLSMVLEKYKQAIEEKTIVSWEETSNYPTGTLTGYVSISPVLNSIGKCTHLVGSVHDITETKLVGKALLKSENKYRSLVETSQDLIWQCDAEGSYIYLNPAWEEVFGYKIEEMLGKKFSDFQTPERAAIDLFEFSELMKGLTVHGFETVHLGKAGNDIHLVFNAKFVTDENGNITGTQGTAYDITKRKQAEETLLLRESYLSAIIENQPGLLWLKDRNGKFLAANNKFLTSCELNNMTLLLGKTDLDIWPQELALKYRDDDAKVIESGKSCIVEEVISDKGIIKWFETFKTPVLDDSGNVIGTTGFSRDITERKMSEQALLESKEKYEKLVIDLNKAQSVAKVGSWKWHFVENRLEWSNEMYQIFGISKDEFTGNLADVIQQSIHPDDRAAVDASNNSVIEKNMPIPLEYRLVMPDGTIKTVWAEAGEIIKNDTSKPIALTGIVQDITERKKVEDALRDSEGKLSALFASMTEMVALHEVVFNKKGEPVNYQITDCNLAYTQITGIKKEDAIGKLATEVYGTEKPPYLDEFTRVAITGEPYAYTTYFAPMDKHFSISVVSPKINQFATITTDISAMQQIQEVITIKNRELENYLFVSSHDLRSPLVNIQGFSQRLQKQIHSINSLIQECALETEIKSNLAAITNKSIPETLNYIFTSVAKMDVLINSLLLISRVGRIKMEIKKVDIDQLFKNILKVLNFQLTEISATVSVEKMPHCYGDENTLNQLFTNILDNTIKYRKPSVPLICIIEGKAMYNKVIYSFKDNGVGIPAKHLNKIWDVFYQVDPTIKDGGEGIGLSIAKRIVDKHKGKIWVESDEGIGTTFYIELNTKEFEE